MHSTLWASFYFSWSYSPHLPCGSCPPLLTQIVSQILNLKRMYFSLLFFSPLLAGTKTYNLPALLFVSQTLVKNFFKFSHSKKLTILTVLISFRRSMFHFWILHLKPAIFVCVWGVVLKQCKCAEVNLCLSLKRWNYNVPSFLNLGLEINLRSFMLYDKHFTVWTILPSLYSSHF